jgi:hypothetical protein
MCQRQDCGSLPLPGWKVLMFQLFTVLSYANSAINPFLYAFASSHFRQRFSSIFSNCLSSPTSSSAVVVRRELPADGRRVINEHRDRRTATSTSHAMGTAAYDRRAKVQTGNGGTALAEVALSVVVELHEIPNGIAIVRSVRTQTLTAEGFLL